MKLFELPHLAISSPTQIAVAGVLQIHTGDLLEATRRIEARSQLVGERLIVHKAVCAGRVDGLFVEALGIELAAVEAGNLRADQRGTVCKILRAVLGPFLKLAVMRGQCLQMPGPLRIAGCAAERGPRQRGIEMVFRPLEVEWRRPEQ